MSQLIATASDSLQIWDFLNQEECRTVSTCSFTGTATSLSWNHTNQVVAVALSDKRIDLIQATTGQLLSTLPFTSQEGILAQLRAVRFSGNSRYLASAEGNLVKLWDLKKRSLKTKLEGHKSPVVAVSFFVDGTIAASDSGGAIKIWDVKTESSYREIDVDKVAADRSVGSADCLLSCMELSLSGPSRVATGYSDGSLCLWDPITLSQVRKHNVHRLEISAVAFSPKNPRLIATSSFDGRMTLVDTGSKSSDASASIDIGGKLTSITFHEDAIHCAVGTENGRVLFYDWRNVRKPVVAIECEKSRPVRALSFQVPKLKSDSATGTPVRKSAPATPEAPPPPASSVTVTHKPTALFSPETTPVKAVRAEPSSAAKIGLEQEINRSSTAQARIGQAAVDAIKRSVSSSSTYNNSEREYDRGLTKSGEMGGSWKEFPTRISTFEPDSTGYGMEKDRISGSKVPAAGAVSGPILRSPSASGSSLPAPRQVSVPAAAASDSMPSFHSIYDNNNQCDDDNSRKNPNWKGHSSQPRPVTAVELNDALQLVKYDMHREIQGLMKEQVRQFSIAQADTSKLFKNLNAQLQELLESNAALRAENDHLRRIY